MALEKEGSALGRGTGSREASGRVAHGRVGTHLSTRIPRVGRWARAFTWVCFVIVTASFLAFVASGAFGDSLEATILAVTFQTLGLLGLLRSFVVGAHTTPTGVRIVSWLRTREFVWRDVRRCDAIPYSGMLSKGIETRLLSMIQITLVGGSQVSLHASVTTPRAALDQARALNDIIRTHRDDHR
jgi:hypothetical protein